jgi:uncharacterized DUF497 family protein
MHVLWDPKKRQFNLDKHGLLRTQSLAYVFDMLAVLTVVHVSRENSIRIISFRPASEIERTAYHDWLENDFDDAR